MQGAGFEAGLVERILDDVGEKPGNLPLLEFTLTQLWERQADGWLTHADYAALGGVEGAVAAYADQVYGELPPAEQERARRALVQLVRPGEGTEDTRRVALREELGEENWRLIQHLADRRLVVTGRDAGGRQIAEVVHEALIARWGRFREWMNADRAFRAWQERLRGSLRQWEESREDDGALLAGGPLLVAENWLAERGGDLGEAEAKYIRDGLALQARRQQERQRRRQRLVWGLAAGLVVVAALAVLAFIASQRASRSAATAQAEANRRATAEAVAVQARDDSLKQSAILLAGQAETELSKGYGDRAVLLALAALEQFPYTWQAEHALGQAVSYTRAVQQYNGHQSGVTSVAWSPDGTRVASSSSMENRVDIWDPVTGKMLRTITMPAGLTNSKFDMALNVLWSLDGKRLVTLGGERTRTGSQDYVVVLWDAETGAQLATTRLANQAKIEGGFDQGSIFLCPTGAAAEIAPRSGRLATLGGDNTALIWDAAWEKPAITLSGHTRGINSVDWSPDETKLATASLDGTVMVWDAQTGKALTTLTGHLGRLNAALWSPDGSQIASAGEDGIIRIWNAADGALARSIETNAGEVFSLAWAPNGVRLFSGHGEGSIRIWETASGKPLETLRGPQGTVTDLKWSPTDDRLAAGDGNGDARIWNAAPSTAWRLYPPQAARGGLWTLDGADWSSDGRYLAVAGGDAVDGSEPPSFAIWDVQANRLLMEQMGDKLHLYGNSGLLFSPNDRLILYRGLGMYPDYSESARAYVFDVQSGEIVHTIALGGQDLMYGTAWSPDGSQLATGLMSGDVIIWDYPSGKQVARLPHEPQGVAIAYVEWSPDGSKFAVASDDGDAHVWDARTWEPLYTVQHEAPAYLGVAAWSPDGKRLLTGGGNDMGGAKDTSARIWDGATGKELLAFRGHAKSVWPGSWSPNGKRVATMGSEGVVKVWDSYTGEELLTITAPILYFGNALWSPDGKHLVIVGNDTLVSVWRVWQSKEELLEYARECCVFRQLTETERAQFGLR
jgi:WD40 repeat protein